MGEIPCARCAEARYAGATRVHARATRGGARLLDARAACVAIAAYGAACIADAHPTRGRRTISSPAAVEENHSAVAFSARFGRGRGNSSPTVTIGSGGEASASQASWCLFPLLLLPVLVAAASLGHGVRSEERRVGKEGGSVCGWSGDDKKER